MKNPWFPLYDGDLLANTMHLGPTEFGIYVRLIIHAYNHHGEIPSDKEHLCHITGCAPQRWHFHEKTVLQFFDPVEGGNRVHKRVVHELARSHEISNKRKTAALQMHSKRNASAHANGGVITTHAHAHASSTNSNAGAGHGASARSNGSPGAGPAPPTVELPILSYREEQRLLDAYRKQRKAEEQGKRS